MQNLYFAYLLVLRAVVKAGPLLSELDYNTGFAKEDAATRRLVTSLVGSWLRGQGREGGGAARMPSALGSLPSMRWRTQQ